MKTPRPLYPGGRAPGTPGIGWVGPKPGLDAVEKRKILPLEPVAMPTELEAGPSLPFPRVTVETG
jgi:hypothetical protein